MLHHPGPGGTIVMRTVDPRDVHPPRDQSVNELVVIRGLGRKGDHDPNRPVGRGGPESRLAVPAQELMPSKEVAGIRFGDLRAGHRAQGRQSPSPSATRRSRSPPPPPTACWSRSHPRTITGCALARAGRCSTASVSPGSGRATASTSTSADAASGSAPTAAIRAPTARPRCSRTAASRRAIYAPVPWLLSSAGWAAWIETSGPGVELDLTCDEISVCVRRAAGPLRLHLLVDPTPAARLRAFLRATGFPALLPEWAYGHWKSRDVYEHQDDVEDDLRGYRGHELPARRDRDRLAVGDAVQHLAASTRTSSRTRADWSRRCARTGCGRWSG